MHFSVVVRLACTIIVIALWWWLQVVYKQKQLLQCFTKLQTNWQLYKIFCEHFKMCCCWPNVVVDVARLHECWEGLLFLGKKTNDLHILLPPVIDNGIKHRVEKTSKWMSKRRWRDWLSWLVMNMKSVFFNVSCASTCRMWCNAA